MKMLYLKGYKWLLSQRKMTFLVIVIDGTRHWLSISNLFEKNSKVKGLTALV